MTEEERLKHFLQTQKIRELPSFGKLLVVAFSFFFGIFVRAVGLIRKKSKGGEKP